jgi:uncharacterized protein (TIGR02246 family)
MTHVLALVLTVAAANPVFGQARPGASTDEQSVREVVRKYVDARDRKDAAAVRALFTEDADQLTSSGEWRRGREEVVKGSLASSAANSGARTITIDAVRFPATGMALADGAYTIGSGETVRNMRTSFVLVRREGAWLISAIRNMLPAK